LFIIDVRKRSNKVNIIPINPLFRARFAWEYKATL